MEVTSRSWRITRGRGQGERGHCGQKFSGTPHEDFPMRREQADAVEKTYAYCQSIRVENKKAVPRFQWNAKMRFLPCERPLEVALKLRRSPFLAVSSPPELPCRSGCRF